MMTPIDIAWVAGIIEGEGSIHIPENAGRHYPSVRVSMTDQDIIDRLLLVTGIGNVVALPPPKVPHHKQQWQWHVCKRKDVARLLLAVAPLMGERRSARILEAAEALSRNYRRQVVASCGTRSGYNRHRYLGEPTCDGCREAVRLASKEHKTAASRKKETG